MPAMCKYTKKQVAFGYNIESVYVKKAIRLSFLLVIALVMAGCVTFHLKPISQSKIISAFDARTLDNTDLKKYMEKTLHSEIVPWPLKSWDFNKLILAAFYYHPDLDVARAQWGVAKAGVTAAGARPNPNISLVPYEANTLPIPIETAGKRGYRIAQARHLSEAASLNITTTAWRVRNRLRTSLLDLYAATQTQAILNRQLEGQEEMVRLLERRLAVGEASQFEVTQTHIVMDSTRLSLHEAQKQIAEVRVQLSDAIGLPVRALEGINISFDFIERSPPNPAYEDVRCQALLNRSDILEAIAKYEASQAVLQLEIAKQYPNFNLGPGLLWNGVTVQWTLVFSTSLPIFNQNKGPIAEAEASRAEMAKRFTSLQAQVIKEIDQAFAGFNAALRKLETADSLLSARKKQLQSVESMLKVGGVDRLTLLGSRMELYSTELSHLEALQKVQQSLGLLETAVQKPIDSPESFLIVPEVNPRAEKEDEK